MLEPDKVALCVEAMCAAVSVPVTVKCRIGVDDQNPEQVLPAFIDGVAGAGAAAVIVHARKAWLEGLSPKDNRTVPPLDYPLVYGIKRRHPGLPVVINGGISTLGEVEEHLRHVDGVMLGRVAYQNPYRLAEIESSLYPQDAPLPSRIDVARHYAEYLARGCEAGVPLHAMTRHVLGLFQSMRGARAYRRHLSENATRPGAGVEVFHQAVDLIVGASDPVAQMFQPLGERPPYGISS